MYTHPQYSLTPIKINNSCVETSEVGTGEEGNATAKVGSYETGGEPSKTCQH